MPGKGRIIAIANQKGGVGKTTTAVNLAVALADSGHTVRLVDLDPQGNASTGMGIAADDRDVTTYDLLTGEATRDDASVSTSVDRLSLIPATADLSSLDLELGVSSGRLHRLRTALRATADGQTITIIDCPPTLGLLTLNALVAADGLLVPLQTEFYALEGLSQLMLTLREVRRSANPALRLDGVVLTMLDGRNNLSQQVEADARATLGGVVFDTIIPRNVRLSEAPSHGLSALRYDPQSRGSQAYRALAAEYLGRIDNKRGT
ncbi:ParA family protein [Paracoccus suum]|uniref:Chromosome partitioning protein ParA n=1 Tax=Paracoccus suum TaxID=2259340 RepID=A0A344PHS7_9RHOB|nr:ParA family protein [Paracoccus suum]AXC48932.1 ParA family protein [Paracoccus suum]